MTCDWASTWLRPVSWTRTPLYEALSLQQRVAAKSRSIPSTVSEPIARSLPARVAARHKLVPFKLDLGVLFVAGPELPTPECGREVERFHQRSGRVSPCDPENYRELVNELLPA